MASFSGAATDTATAPLNDLANLPLYTLTHILETQYMHHSIAEKKAVLYIDLEKVAVLPTLRRKFWALRESKNALTLTITCISASNEI
jgi:hypothetical protein